jgi:hypothetical protein
MEFFMEIEFDAPKGQVFYPAIVIVALLALAGLGWLGQGVTRVGEDGRALVLTWTDYQVAKMEREYLAQKTRLRGAVEDIARLFARNPSPMEAQIHLDRIEKDVSANADFPGLADARQAVLLAADAVRAYSLGKISHTDTAGAIHYAAELLAE